MISHPCAAFSLVQKDSLLCNSMTEQIKKDAEGFAVPQSKPKSSKSTAAGSSAGDSKTSVAAGSWQDYFDSSVDVKVGDDVFKAYRAGDFEKSPCVFVVRQFA